MTSASMLLARSTTAQDNNASPRSFPSSKMKQGSTARLSLVPFRPSRPSCWLCHAGLCLAGEEAWHTSVSAAFRRLFHQASNGKHSGNGADFILSIAQKHQTCGTRGLDIPPTLLATADEVIMGWMATLGRQLSLVLSGIIVGLLAKAGLVAHCSACLMSMMAAWCAAVGAPSCATDFIAARTASMCELIMSVVLRAAST